MDADFWHEKWRSNQIHFHEGRANGLLVRCFDSLGWTPGTRVLLPLCGKAEDIDWLRAQGCRVAGIELHRAAIEAVFERLGVEPRIEEHGALTAFRADGLDLFVGDFFALTADVLGAFDAAYDRAALVALPADTRRRYAAHLMEITGAAPQFLVALDYDQSQMNGPPFSVGAAEVRGLYDTRYRVEQLVSTAIAGPLAERCSGNEVAWALTPR